MAKENQNNNLNYLWLIAVVFLLLALSFVFDVWGKKREVLKHPLVAKEYFTKDSVETPMLRPVLIQDGNRYSCNDCHQNIEPSTVQKSFFSAHPDVTLEHGANNYCMTCHNFENREMLVDLNKNEIKFSQSEKTCLQCHGPIYRDWENGVHGRMKNFWDETKGAKSKLTCVQCHDPHNPKFKPMKPSPAPKIQNYREFLGSLSVKENTYE